MFSPRPVLSQGNPIKYAATIPCHGKGTTVFIWDILAELTVFAREKFGLLCHVENGTVFETGTLKKRKPFKKAPS